MNSLKVIVLVVIIAILLESVEMKSNSKSKDSTSRSTPKSISSRSTPKLKSKEIARCDGMLSCANGTCLTIDRICDTVMDCDQGEDESECPPPSCPACQVCDVCGEGEISCIHKTTKERECVSTCDTEIDCELQEDKTTLPTCPSTCPSEDWMRFKTSCYKIVSDESEKKTRPDAKAECESLNATLVNIETDMELTFISCKLLERDGPGAEVDYWTGAILLDGVWKWEGTEIVVNSWGYGAPNKGGTGATLYGKFNYLLDDAASTFDAFYICELEDA